MYLDFRQSLDFFIVGAECCCIVSVDLMQNYYSLTQYFVALVITSGYCPDQFSLLSPEEWTWLCGISGSRHFLATSKCFSDMFTCFLNYLLSYQQIDATELISEQTDIRMLIKTCSHNELAFNRLLTLYWWSFCSILSAAPN